MSDLFSLIYEKYGMCVSESIFLPPSGSLEGKSCPGVQDYQLGKGGGLSCSDLGQSHLKLIIMLINVNYKAESKDGHSLVVFSIFSFSNLTMNQLKFLCDTMITLFSWLEESKGDLNKLRTL